MPVLRLFASARLAARGRGSAQFDGATVGEVLESACRLYGDEFVAILEISRIWVNGEPQEMAAVVSPVDEIAVLPPVSGG